MLVSVNENFQPTFYLLSFIIFTANNFIYFYK